VGGYMIVEDSVINHGLARDHPGPYKAIEDFLAENSDFVADREREQFVLTWNPKGYLKRIAKTITGE
jgi:cephalosporin hydroxylase